MQYDLFAQPQRFGSFDELLTAMNSLTDDPLAAFGTNMVIYRGNPSAGVMVVGEAPGAEEDRLGTPFVGRSGKLLDQILTAGGFDVDVDVIVTNAAYRRPPENRKPTADEIAFYQPYLLEMIRIVNPQIIVLAGAAAVESLLDEKRGITKIRGQWFRWSDRWVMPVFHPAYLLRNPSHDPGSPKALTWQDVQEIKRKFDELRLGAAQ